MSNIPKQQTEQMLSLIKSKVIYDSLTGKFNRGSIHNSGYVIIALDLNGIRHTLYGHHIAWFLYHGSWPIEQLDHKDRVKTHNWITNLQYSNAHNQLINCDRSLSRDLPPGVRKNTIYDTYYAEITVNNKRVYLGSYPSAYLASEAYQNAKERANQRNST